MKIAAVQMEPVWENRQANYAQVERIALGAKDQSIDWLVLPEMFATGFSMNTEKTAEAFDGPTVAFVRTLVATCGLGVVAGLVLAGDPNADGSCGPAKNTALASAPDGEEHRYVKTHLFAHMDEHRAHQAGLGPRVFSMGEFQAACFICYDLRFPELFRMVAEECQLMVVIASWPQSRQFHWDHLLQARAIENQCYVVGVNRVGQGGGHAYTGGSAIYGPMGERLAHAGESPGLLVAEIDLQRVLDTRAALPFLKDKRFV